MRNLQSRTRNGNIIIDNSRIYNKQIQLKEKKLNAEKLKLSVSQNNNINMHSKINELRKEQILQNEIKHNTVSYMQYIRIFILYASYIYTYASYIIPMNMCTPTILYTSNTMYTYTII